MQRALIFSAIFTALLAGSHSEAKPQDPPLPIFDVHMHYHHLSSSTYSPEQIVKIFDAAGVTHAMLSSYPNDNTHLLYDLAPSKFVLGLMPYRTVADRLDWFKKPECLKVVEEELNAGKYPYCILGEFILWDWKDADQPGVQRLVQLAKQYKLPMHVTTGPMGVQKLFAQYPEAKIILAHAGTFAKEPIAGPADLDALLAQYPNLFLDLAQLDGRVGVNIEANGVLKPEWKNLFLKYPGRIMVGTDPVTAEMWTDFSRWTDKIRGWLGQLPPEAANKIAFANADNFFGSCLKESPAK